MKLKSGRRPNRVTAIFKNAALTFNVARETTLAQLADQVSALSEANGGLPLLVNIRVAAESNR